MNKTRDATAFAITDISLACLDKFNYTKLVRD